MKSEMHTMIRFDLNLVAKYVILWLQVRSGFRKIRILMVHGTSDP